MGRGTGMYGSSFFAYGRGTMLSHKERAMSADARSVRNGSMSHEDYNKKHGSNRFTNQDALVLGKVLGLNVYVDADGGLSHITYAKSNRGSYFTSYKLFSAQNGSDSGDSPSLRDIIWGERDRGSDIKILGGAILAANGKRFLGATINPGSEILYQIKDTNMEGKFGGKPKDRFMASYGLSWSIFGAEYKHSFVAPNGKFDSDLYEDQEYEISGGLGGFVIKYNWGDSGKSLFYGFSLGGTIGGGIGVDAETWDGRRIKF